MPDSSPVRHTYDDVLAALARTGPATTMAVYAELDGDRHGGSARKRRRGWMFHALLNLARDGKVEYVIEDGVYMWRTASVPRLAEREFDPFELEDLCDADD